MPRINELLRDYGTSLEEMRRMHKEVQPLLQAEFERAMLPKIYTYQEAKDLFGVDLPEPGYMLKVTPDRTLEEGYRASYIAPSGYEFGENLVTTPEGETMDWQKFEELIAQQTMQAVVPQRTPEELAMLAYEAPWTEEDIQQTMGLIEAQEVAYKQYMDEYEQTQRIFGKVFPNADVDAVIKFADENPDAFLRAIRAIGRSEDTEAILRRMLPGISDTDIDKLLTPLPEGAYYIEGTNLLVDPLDFSYIKSGVPNFGTFKEVYYQVKGWPDININTLAPGQMAEMQEIRDREVQARAEYEKRFGAGNFWASRVSAPLQYILPASGKFLDPEKPDINPTDIIFDVATVIPGLGYISKAGHLVKNAVLASKLVRIAETTSAAGFTVAQGLMLKEGWQEMGGLEKGMLLGFSTLTAGLTVMGARSLLTSQAKQRIKDIAKNIGAEAKEIAASETGTAFGSAREAPRRTRGGVIPESVPGGSTKAETQFLDEMNKLSPEERQLVYQEIQRSIKEASLDLERIAWRTTSEEAAKANRLINKQIVTGVIQGKMKKVVVDGVEQLVPATTRVGQDRVMTLGNYIKFRFARQGELPQAFSKGDANIMAGYPQDHVWPDNMLNSEGKVMREYVMDRIAQETGYENYDDIIEVLNSVFEGKKGGVTSSAAEVEELISGLERQKALLEQNYPALMGEPQMAPSTSVQAGFAGMAPEGQQIKAFEEFATAPGTGGEKAPLIAPKPTSKPLPGQQAMPETPPTKASGGGQQPPKKPPTDIAQTPEESGAFGGKDAIVPTALSRAEAEEVYRWMADFIASGELENVREAVDGMRKSVLKHKFNAYHKRVQELIVKEGKGYEEAMGQAKAEAMKGTLPDIKTDYLGWMTDLMKDSLYAKILAVYPRNAGKQFTAKKVIDKLIRGATLAFHEGKEYSEMVILRELFGDQPKMLKKLTQANKEKRPLRDVVEGRFYEMGQKPVPRDEDMAEYLKGLDTGGRQAGLETGGIPWGGSKVIGEMPQFQKPTFGMGGKQLHQDIPDEIFEAAQRVNDKWNPTIPPQADTRTDLQKLIAYLRLKANKTPEEIANLEKYESWERINAAKAPELLKWVDNPADVEVIQTTNIPIPQQFIIYRILKEVGLTAVDIGNMIRAIRSTCDFSFWRQQAPLIVLNAREFLPANVEAFKAIFKQSAAEASWSRITKDPLYAIYERIGADFLRPLHLPKGTARWRGVEEYGYLQGTDRPIPKFTEKIPFVKYSERAFITGTNEHNWRIFKKYYKAMSKQSDMIASGKIKLKPGEAFDIEASLKKISTGLEDLTGRAQLGRIGDLAPVANSMFFSLRLNLGRILTVRDLLSPDPILRKFAWGNALSFVGTITAVELLGERLGLWDIETDPRSADFMTIRIGNTRVDPWGGYKQFVVFMSRVFTGTGISSVTGQEYDADFMDIAGDLFRSKLSPFASAIVDFFTGENYIGEPIDLTNIEQWADRIAPFALVDLYEAYRENIMVGMAVTIPVLLGASVQTYTGNWDENYAKLGLPKYEDNLAYNITDPVYDVQDFFADTAHQFRGVDLSKLTEAKGYSKAVQAVVEADRIRDAINLLPNQKLTSINADPTKGNTYKEYFAQWQERQKIVASGDEEALRKFDQDDRTKNAYLGNFSNRQLQLLDEYHNLPLNEREDFLKAHPEINQNPREEYLRTHPEENAKLAVWGQANVLTQRAYDMTVQMAIDLDIPDKALRDHLPPADLAKPYFDYNEAVAEFSANSAEAMIVRAKNPKLTEWLKLEPVRTPIEALEINIKNRTLNEQYDGYSDRNSRWYIADPDARENARKEFRENNPEWVDDRKRIEVYNNNGNETILTEWVEHDRIQRQFGASSPEAKLYLIDHPETFEWAVDNGLLEDEGKDWNIPVLRINAQYRQQDEYYNSIQNDDPRIQAQLREDYLNANPEYRIARIERDGLELGITTPNLLNEWTEYNQLPEYGYWRKRYLKEHPELFGEVTRLQKEKGRSVWETIEPDKIPAAEYDQIYEQYKDLFDQYENVQGTATERQAQREAMLNDNPRFRDAYYARQAYKLLFPEEFIANYVEYYRIPESGYADERYLKEHPEFYAEMFRRKEWKDPIDFEKVPSVELERLINIYDKLPTSGKQREAYRKEYPELDEWLMKYRGLKPVGHAHKKTSESEIIERMESRKWQVEQIKRLIAMLR